MTRRPGRQFFNAPGPTNIPDRILRAMDQPVMDFLDPVFERLAEECLAGLKKVFRTEQRIITWASTGHGSWEASLSNVISSGERILVAETGAFAVWWKEMAEALGIEVEMLAGDWRHGADPDAIEQRLRADTERKIKAVCVVHNETSAGITSRCGEIGAAIKASGHDALYLVDTISSLGSMDFRMDDWGVDVAVGGSQKGLMLPTGLGIVGVSERAMDVAKSTNLPRRYFDFNRAFIDGEMPRFPGTSPVHLMFGLRESLKIFEEEGMDAIFARHARLAGAVRASVAAWRGNDGPELNALLPQEQSNSVSTILMPEDVDVDAFRAFCRDRFNLILGGGLMRFAGKAFRIGHLGDSNEAMILGALATIETAFRALDIPHGSGGLDAAVDHLATEARPA